jgi:hypothetical protein
LVGAVLRPYFIVPYTVNNSRKIEYSTVYNTIKYGHNTAPTKRRKNIENDRVFLTWAGKGEKNFRLRIEIIIIMNQLNIGTVF